MKSKSIETYPSVRPSLRLSVRLYVDDDFTDLEKKFPKVIWARMSWLSIGRVEGIDIFENVVKFVYPSGFLQVFEKFEC